MKAEDIAKIFRRVLEAEDIDERSDFFVMGGDSLLATRVLTSIAKECGIHLSLVDLLDSPTPIGLAGTLSRASS